MCPHFFDVFLLMFFLSQSFLYSKVPNSSSSSRLPFLTILDACKDAGMNPPPKITFIVVGKRHHMKFAHFLFQPVSSISNALLC